MFIQVTFTIVRRFDFLHYAVDKSRLDYAATIESAIVILKVVRRICAVMADICFKFVKADSIGKTHRQYGVSLNMDIDVSTIADNELIRDIFKFKYWEIDDGIDYLVGIYKGHEKDGLQELTTLDGRVFTELEHAKEINELYARHDRVREIWDHGSKMGRRYFPSTFIKWGLQYREAVKLSWLSDAQVKGLVPNDIDKPKTKPEAELRESERTILLRIIHGLSLKAFKEPPNKHGLQKQIAAILDSNELHVGENTLGKHLNAAANVPRRTFVSPKSQ